MTIIKEINTQTGEEIERPINAEELTQLAKDDKEYKARQFEAVNKKAAKSALLNKLGITEDEALLLLS